MVFLSKNCGIPHHWYHSSPFGYPYQEYCILLKISDPLQMDPVPSFLKPANSKQSCGVGRKEIHLVSERLRSGPY